MKDRVAFDEGSDNRVLQGRTTAFKDVKCRSCKLHQFDSDLDANGDCGVCQRDAQPGSLFDDLGSEHDEA